MYGAFLPTRLKRRMGYPAQKKMNGVVKEMLLPSPKGWIQAQDLVPGDELFGSDGKVLERGGTKFESE